MAAAPVAPEKKTRWRKDKKDGPEKETGAAEAEPALRPGALLTRPGALAENKAGARAFQGLHGVRSNFSLVAGVTSAVDDAYRTVLGGNAFYYQELLCRMDDFTMYEALVEELEYKQCWMYGGQPLYRPTALGREEALKRSPTYERIVRWLAGHFGVEPLRSLVNYYRNGDDYTSFHSDQYFDGVDMTIGASFGEERNLLFEHRDTKEQFNFPQRNGDIFAFTEEVNNVFSHAVPKERRRAHSTSRRHTPGRISVIVWARKDQPQWHRLAATKSLNLLDCPHVLDYNPKSVGASAGADGQTVLGNSGAAASTASENKNVEEADGQSNLEDPGAAVSAPGQVKNTVDVDSIREGVMAQNEESKATTIASAPRWGGRGRGQAVERGRPTDGRVLGYNGTKDSVRQAVTGRIGRGGY